MNKSILIYELLYKFMESLDKVNKHGIKDFIYTLKKDRYKYDNMFYNYATAKKISTKNLKIDCINEIMRPYYGKDNIDSNVDYVDEFNDLSLEKLENIIDYYFNYQKVHLYKNNFIDIFDIYDSELNLNIENIIHLNDYQELFNEVLNWNRLFLKDTNEFYQISKKEELILCKTIMCSRAYQIINYYKTNQEQGIIPSGFQLGNDFKNIYEKLDKVESIIDVMRIYNNNSMAIIGFYIAYNGLEKILKNEVEKSIIDNNKQSNLFKICPYAIFSYRKHFDIRFENEQIESIRLGKLTLKIINDFLKQSKKFGYSNNEVLSFIVDSIKGFYLEEDILAWCSYLASNVYSNIVANNEDTKLEKEYIRLIESDFNIKKYLSDKEFMEYIIYKFYQYNCSAYDDISLKELRDILPEEKKQYIKKINPYYTSEEKYFKQN